MRKYCKPEDKGIFNISLKQPFFKVFVLDFLIQLHAKLTGCNGATCRRNLVQPDMDAAREAANQAVGEKTPE